MKKLLAVVLAFTLVLSLGALAFAAGSPTKADVSAAHGAGDAAGAVIVKFDNGEVRVATPIAAPFTDEQNTAIALANKVVTGADAVEDEALKAFFAENALPQASSAWVRKLWTGPCLWLWMQQALKRSCSLLPAMPRISDLLFSTAD